MHGDKRQRRPSEHGLQLLEKQKVRWYYGLLERQFRRYFEEAARQSGVTGENLLRLLELRLDSVVYRLGFAETRPQARQLVNHGHIMVNGRKVDIPSFATSPGDVITVRPRSKNTEYFKTLAVDLGNRRAPEWLTMDSAEMTGKVVRTPARVDMVLPPFNEQLVVEYYSRRV
jgi:small subunit ribosomal protein S4